jgi:hypothetical protein
LLDSRFGGKHIIVTSLFCSVCIPLATPKYFLSSISWQNLKGSHTTIGLLVGLFTIDHRLFWKLRSHVDAVAMPTDMVRAVLQ